jgi:hypothetical protein
MTDDAALKRSIRARMAATGEKYTQARREVLRADGQFGGPQLFDDRERTDSSPATSGEDTFSFLNRASGIVWSRIRAVCEAWFSAYPAAHAADLRGRFRSKHAGAHLRAWWELYLHHLFTSLGYNIDVHPAVAGTDNRPDFLLRRGRERLYVEAAVVFSGIVDDDGRNGVREGWIIDAANRGSSPNFFVGIDFEQVGTTRPRDRAIYEPIEKWLSTLDPDQVTAEHESGGDLPEFTIDVNDWRVRFRAIPIKPEARGKAGARLVGMGPVTAGFIDDKAQIRDTLKHKGGRYGSLDAPFVVAINCVGSFPEDEDIANALHGSIAVQVDVGRPGSSRTVRLRDGAWIDEQGPRGQRTSAVLSAVQLSPHTAVRFAPQIWHHGSPDQPLAVSWPFTEWHCSEQGVIEKVGRAPDMAEVLGLPREWPGPEPAFERAA